ncbi:MAG: enoyl-CoA hydratase [Acidimicrobiia bacterium]
MGDDEKLVMLRDGAVATIVFNNPARHNAVSLAMWERMLHLLADLRADDEVRVLVLSGAGGKAFVSGADISKFESERAGREATERYNATSGQVYEELAAFPKPTVAKISGFCLGGGVNLAVCCDLRIATAGSRFGVPAARLGVGYGYDAVQRLASVVGLSTALDLLYTARHVPADEALALGLVNRVVPTDDLDAEVHELADTIARHAPLTIAAVKAAAVQLRRPEAERNTAAIDALVSACFASTDYTEGRIAFTEKRSPRFTGQ